MTEVIIEEVLAALSERGRLEWELATKTAVIKAQSREIETLRERLKPAEVPTNGQELVGADA